MRKIKKYNWLEDIIAEDSMINMAAWATYDFILKYTEREAMIPRPVYMYGDKYVWAGDRASAHRIHIIDQ